MKKLFFAVVAMLFAACTTDVTKDVTVEVPETLTVSFEESSRIQLNEGKTVWTAGDLVSVFYRSDANQQWKFNGQTGATTAELTKVVEPEATNTLSKVVTIYPYNENYTIDAECKVTATLPAEQEYLADSFGVGSSIMVAESESNNAQLRNAMGWLRLHLTGDGEVVKSITVKGNNSEQVAGQITINPSDASITLAESSTATTVTLNCAEGVTLSSEATAFYIALPPQEFSRGFTLKVLYDDDTTMTKSTSNSVTIKRNTILPMDALYYDGNTPPVYELAYTTNNSQPLDPYTTEGFGANFLENIYDAETGKGSLKFDGRITTIPANAFIACTNLTWIDIPNCITTIGDKAFYGCSAVESLTLPSSITSIGKSAFENCTGKVTINCRIYGTSSSSYGNFYKAKFTEVVIGNSVTNIGQYAFYYCSSMTSVTIPDSITKIEKSAFDCCYSIKDVYYQGNLSGWCKIKFSSSANPLYYQAKLYIDHKEVTDIIVPSDITSIGDYTFTGFSSLTSVTIHDRVTEIGVYAFYNCSSLTGVTIPDSITTIGDRAFCSCDSLTNVTIGNSVTKIGEGTFYGCRSITNIAIPDRVTEIGDRAFCSCDSLTNVTIGNRVATIGKAAFEYCSNLASITIGNRVTTIGLYAFENCISLTSITIPDSVTEIGQESFYNCTNLKEVFCKPTTPPTGGNNMFSYGEYTYYAQPIGCIIYVPASDDDSIINAYKAADYWKDYADYIEEYDFTE